MAGPSGLVVEPATGVGGLVGGALMLFSGVALLVSSSRYCWFGQIVEICCHNIHVTASRIDRRVSMWML